MGSLEDVLDRTLCCRAAGHHGAPSAEPNLLAARAGMCSASITCSAKADAKLLSTKPKQAAGLFKHRRRRVTPGRRGLRSAGSRPAGYTPNRKGIDEPI